MGTRVSRREMGTHELSEVLRWLTVASTTQTIAHVGADILSMIT